MKKIRLLPALLAALVLAGCAQGAAAGPVPSEQSAPSAPTSQAAQSAGAEAPTEVYVPQYAKGFEIEYYAGGAKVLYTHIAQTASTQAVSQRVLLLPEGVPEPQGVTYDHVIRGNVTSAVAMASSHAGHYANLDAVDVLKGTSIAPESCYVQTLKAALDTGETVYVGLGSKADKELIVSLRPQVVSVGGMASDVEVAQKLEESGLFCLYFGDFAEGDYLGRAQWIEAVGALLGKEEQARAYIAQSVSEIEQIQDVITKAGLEKPKVLWFSHSSAAPHWNVRTNLDYVNSIVFAAGGELLYPAGADANSVKLSNEDFLYLMNEADRIVMGVSLNSYPDAKDMTYFNKEDQIDFASSAAFQNKGCWVVGYNWAQDTANTAKIIRSAAACFYPELFSDVTPDDKSMMIAFSGK